MHGGRARGYLEQAVIQEPHHLTAGPGPAMAKRLGIDQRPHAAAIGDRHHDPAFWGEDTPRLAQQLARTVGLFQGVE